MPEKESNTALSQADPDQWGEDDISDLTDDEVLPTEVDLGDRSSGSADETELMKYAWSQIASRIAFGIDMSGLVAWIDTSRPKTKKERMALYQLLELALDELTSFPCRRESIILAARAEQELWITRIPDDRPHDLAEARRLFSIESAAAQVMADLQTRELKYGRESVKLEAERWFTAKMRREQCQYRAANNLCPEAHMVYTYLQVEQETIKSIAMDQAKGLPVRDYTKLLADIQEGKIKDPATAIAASGLRFLQQAVNYAQFEQSSDNPRLAWLQTVLTGLPQRVGHRRSYRRDNDREE